MKKGIIIFSVVAIVMLFGFMSIYNSLVSKNEKINKDQAEIDNQLKRRADLVPNLVSTVKGLTAQELKLVEAVTSARVKMTTGTTQEKLAGSAELKTSINLLVENYPVLKSDTAFTGLMDELAGTENRIGVARTAYNNDVGTFNTTIKTFPSSIVAAMNGFANKPYFETTDAEKAVQPVQF